MKTKLLKIARKSPARTGVRLNRKLVTFIACLVIATGFWFLSSLSKEYAGQMTVPVIYTNLPKDKVISNKLVDSIEVEVRTSGFKLLLHKLNGTSDPIRIDMRTARRTRDEGYFYIATNSRIERFSEQLGAGTRITKVIPDTIFLNFNKKTSKKVPVKLNSDIAFKGEFQLRDSIRIEPSHVTVSGAPSVLGNIDFVLTEKLSLKNVDENITRRLKLEPIAGKQVDISVKNVSVDIQVAKFTEGSVELPVDVINLPPGYNVRTFPDKVTVKYQVALSEFESVKGQMFTVIADYSKVKKETGTKLKLELVKSPANIRHARLIPEKVEFIIRK